MINSQPSFGCTSKCFSIATCILDTTILWHLSILTPRRDNIFAVAGFDGVAGSRSPLQRNPLAVVTDLLCWYFVLAQATSHGIPPLSATILKGSLLGPHLRTRRKHNVENGTSLYFPLMCLAIQV